VFERPPLLFHPVEMKRLEQTAEYPALNNRYQAALEERQTAARKVQDGGNASDFRAAQDKVNEIRKDAAKLTHESDTNYIFLSFVTRYLPSGLVGLILGVIFSAAMSASSGEINSLATVTMVDVYQRHFHKFATDKHYLLASRVATVFWGAYAVMFANLAQGFGALIELVNQVGSLFYGSMLGVFVVAFFMRRAGGTAAFWGVLTGQAVVFAVARFSSIAYLWYNMIGCLVVVVVAWAISVAAPRLANPGGNLPDPA
jgi:Na+/proline symporter